MKRFIALFLCCCLLCGCGSDTEQQPSVIETQEAEVATTAATDPVPVVEPEPEPLLFCDYEAELVENEIYSEYIEALDEYAEENEFQGSVLIAWDDEIVLAKGYGYADEKTGRLCNAADTFEIGSVSKQMTAAAIMQLADSGALSVDNTLDKYFPEFHHAENLTIKNLLQMRSGLMDFINSPDQFFPESFVEEYKELADTDENFEETLPRDFLLDYINDSPLCYGPDTCFFYCNTNYYLLGLIIEQVTGDSFQTYMQREIFEPCDMLTANNDFRDTTARGYYDDGTSESMALSTSLGCGSVNASVYDIYQWINHLFGGTVISDASLKEMLTEIEGYGYGMRVNEDLYYHTGNTDCFNAFMAVYGDSFTAVVLTNKPKKILNAGEFGSELHALFADVYAPETSETTSES